VAQLKLFILRHCPTVQTKNVFSNHWDSLIRFVWYAVEDSYIRISSQDQSTQTWSRSRMWYFGVIVS